MFYKIVGKLLLSVILHNLLTSSLLVLTQYGSCSTLRTASTAPAKYSHIIADTLAKLIVLNKQNQ